MLSSAKPAPSLTQRVNLQTISSPNAGNVTGAIITGDDNDNILHGTADDDVIDGGLGADKMYGGAGNDTYYVDNTGDRTYEYTHTGVDDGGIDTVNTTFSLSLGVYLENLTLIGSAVTGNGNALDNVVTGNDLVNTLRGNDGNDTLNGGLGGDRMYGGAGNDTYYVDNASDRVHEDTTTGVDDGGTDTVVSSVSLTLGAYVENLTLTGAAVNGVGNDLNNVITGNDLANTLRGMTGNDALNGGLGADRMYGGAGNDTYVVDNAGDRVYEYVTSGVDDGGTDLVLASINYTLGSFVELLYLTGTSAIDGTGNSLTNGLLGNSGDNRLDGGSGADTLAGSLGNDTYVVDNAGDVVIEYVGEGNDTVISGVTYTLGANLENLTLSGTLGRSGSGNELDNLITGNGANNALKGFDGNDTLDGGLGNDTLTGGLGDDTYVLDNAGDVVVEASGEGSDTVKTTFTYTLGANLENLILLGASAIDGTGNGADNVITGNGAVNILSGLDGNDSLDGGTGADTMTGGLGNDSYHVDNAGDVVVELLGEGTDTVFGTVSTVLSANVENLTLQGSGNLSGTGNGLDNILTGNAGDNALDGGTGNDTLDGGLGNDTLTGGDGNDSYWLDNAGDTVVEILNQGTDTVNAAFTYTLGANIENLTLLGAAAINGTGNSGDNVVTGTSAVNVLTGMDGNDTLDGGLGNDTMIGGLGDDSYYVDSTNDVVTEDVNGGTDTVYSSAASYSLYFNIENLTLTGTGDSYGAGNGLTNIITGNSGNNHLDAGGGTGDTLIGGLGDDSYYVENGSDVVVENAGEGIDSVVSLASYTLSADIENLELSGTANHNAFGNASDNIITGNSGANTLKGNAGNDTLYGASGNDILIGGIGADVFLFKSGGGHDTISDFNGTQGDMINVNSITHGTAHASFIQQVGGDVVVTLNSVNVITITGGTVADVSAHMIW